MVVGGPATRADDEPAVAQVVQQRRLHCQANRMMESQFHNGESDLEMGGPGGHGGAQHQRVRMGGGAVEMVLGQPDRVHADLFCQNDLVQGAVDDG